MRWNERTEEIARVRMLKLEIARTEIAREKEAIELLERRSCKERQLVGVHVG